jgi:uncharacterized protein YxeA
MTKRRRTKGQTMRYKTLHRKLKIEQHEPHQKLGSSYAQKGYNLSGSEKTYSLSQHWSTYLCVETSSHKD